MAVVKDMSVWEMIGQLLAVAAHYIQRRLGGPGATRRLASIIATYIAFIVVLAVGQRAIAGRNLLTVTGSRSLRHLRRPPQGWAAP